MQTASNPPACDCQCKKQVAKPDTTLKIILSIVLLALLLQLPSASASLAWGLMGYELGNDLLDKSEIPFDLFAVLSTCTVFPVLLSVSDGFRKEFTSSLMGTR